MRHGLIPPCAGACFDEGLEEFGVLVGQEATEPDPLGGGLQPEGFFSGGFVLGRFRPVGVQSVSYGGAEHPEVFR